MKATRWFIFIVLAAALLMTACGNSKSDVPAYAGDLDKQDEYSYSNQPVEGAGMAPMPGQSVVAREYEETDGLSVGGSQTGSALRMVIMNASLTVVVEDPAGSMDRITQMASEMGGYVVSSSLYKTYTKTGDEAPEAVITIRVPAERLTEAMNRIKGMVKDAKLDIRNEQVSGQDVTQEYTDLSSRLRNLEATEAQLLEIQRAATTTEEIMMVFNQITQVRGEIELIKGQMKYYEESARLSSVSVTLVAQATVEPVTVAGWQPEGIVRDALQALVDAGKWVVEQLIWFALYILPILLVIGIPGFFIVRAIVRRVRKNAARKAEQMPVPPPSAG